ncbi:hypothetical protein LCGC14_0500200 [marine sediment metagenome]|uniref:Uncharacterized protein n=1 Tax=marine sediment metagenome TaxID=412755 RepID=A0A0F9SMH7_9ZZZZ
MSDPWDRQRDENGELEPSLWWIRFDAYRAQSSGRSVAQGYRDWRDAKGYAKLRHSGYPSSWVRASNRWNWKERAEAWDEHRRQLDYIAEQAQHDEMRKRHADIGKALQGVGAKALMRFQRNESAELEPADARLYLKDGIGIERTARGLPVELVALYNMSDEELQKEHECINKTLTGVAPSQDGDRSDNAGEGPDADAAD